jgi:hypothetical protein
MGKADNRESGKTYEPGSSVSLYFSGFGPPARLQSRKYRSGGILTPDGRQRVKRVANAMDPEKYRETAAYGLENTGRRYELRSIDGHKKHF